MASHPLDNPALGSLLGAHAHLAVRRGRVLRYPSDVAPFVALPDDPDSDTWRDVADLLSPGAILPLVDVGNAGPPGWEVLGSAGGVQLVDADLIAAPDGEAVRLGPDDVEDILALIERTRPGPFQARTIELGTYLGIRRGGRLVAMAGERLHPPGWTEISAVCTDPAVRGQGLATRLVRAVAAGIRERGETPFLHTAADNTGAIRLYEHLGFRLRRQVRFTLARVPGTPADGPLPSKPFADAHDAGAPHSAVVPPVPAPAPRDGSDPTPRDGFAADAGPRGGPGARG
nr:GNAT family N-acetyltransferase [Frankia canadensis]